MHDPVPARAMLRAATRDAHARVDALFAGGFGDRGRYVGYLAGMHAFLGAAIVALPALAEARTRIARDLATLGVAVPATPAAADIGPAQELGWRYVIDGSALGARGLLREAAALGHDAARGAAFLAWHAAGTGWADTRRDLDAYPDDAAQREALRAAAGDAFACAERAFRAALGPSRSAVPA